MKYTSAVTAVTEHQVNLREDMTVLGGFKLDSCHF